MKIRREKQRDVRSHHKNVAVREINEPKHPVHHGVSERNKRVDAAELECIKDLVKNQWISS